MKKLLINALALVALSASLVSCDSTSTGYHTPRNHYNCYVTYDYWGYAYEECYWEYYSNGELVKEKDLAADVGDSQAQKLEKLAQFYSEKFELSADKAIQVATNVRDFSALEDRSESDIADFAQQLYGVDPNTIVSAIGKSQVGQNEELDALIEQASLNFNTSVKNTKALIKALHSDALNENGINL